MRKMKMFNIQEELKKLPAKPGVYLMHDATDEIIYVGKAVSLKNRVRQYFQESRKVTPKIEKMISRIAWFEYIVTDSELEALVLECNLIKEHEPRYNTMLKDGKTYPYIKATIQEPFPRLLFSRELKKDGNRYFGPFTSAAAIRESIELVNRIYHLRNCNRMKKRPCLYHDMGQCPAPCQGYITEEEYRENFEKALKFLQGDTADIRREIQEKMKEAAERMAFEEAAVYRDQLESIRRVTERQKITSDERDDRDVVAMARSGDEAVVQVFFVRDGKVLGREHYYLTGVEYEKDEDVISSFIKQMYAGTPYMPKEIVVEKEFSDSKTILNWLSEKRGHKVYMTIPQRGQKERLLELAKKNAYMVLMQDSEKLRQERARTRGAMEEIEGLLGMEGQLHRVESYDISHINGFETVGSMVVFEEGKQKKNDYRKFRIRSVSGPDDYASMEEMLTRRFEHSKREGLSEGDSFAHLPDIIFMDGGKGQVHVCEDVLKKLEVDIPVCGMVKDDRHRTRGLYFRDEEIPIDTHGQGFHLITRIQDETHRFAIEYHKLIRSKSQTKSVLDDIPGIGPKRRQVLMRAFESLEDIKNATVDSLSEVPGMDRRAAEAVAEYFSQITPTR
ncbi:MAG: excinuclease ABC subunit UvrC [Eubacterium sp.]|nr:excinuclease ABC subunit UvrC [Eubacterium sp.]MBQ7200654.1 excinuclease ABC subunit UvrC [Eubacterium sp.]